MPRIPILNGPSVDRGASPVYQPNLREPDMGGARALATFGQYASNAAQAVDESITKARDEATAVVDANAMLELDSRASSRLSQLRKLQGLAASEQRPAVLEALDKDRQEVAAGIADMPTRQRFLTRSAQALMAYRHQVESHVGQEFEAARSDTLKARTSQFLAMTEGGVDNYEAWDTLRNQARDDIKANATSPAAAEAALSAFDSSTAEAWTRSLLAQGRIGEAEKYVTENRATLGGRFVETATSVAQAKKGAERELLKDQATRDVAGVVEKAKAADGYIDEGKAITAFNELDPDAQQNALPQLRRALAAEAQRKKADVDGWKKSASGQLNTGGYASIDGQLIEKLNTYDPDYLRRLKNEDQLRQDRARRKARGQGGGKSEAKNDRYWLAKFNALPADERASTDVTDFVMGHGVTDLGAETIRVAQRRTIEGLQRGDARAADSFADDLMQDFRALTKKTRSKRPDLTPEEADEYRSKALEAFNDFVDEKKRTPSQAERDGIRRQLLQSVTVSTPREPLFGLVPLPDKTETKRAFQVAPSAPAGGDNFVTLVDENGEELDVDPAKADAILNKHPNLRRK